MQLGMNRNTVLTISLLALQLIAPPARATKPAAADWNKAGLTTRYTFRYMNYFSPSTCLNDLKGFVGCMAAANSIAAGASPRLYLIPKVELGNPTFKFGQVV